MTYRQLVYVFKLNPRLMLEQFKVGDFQRHCERIMRHPADKVSEALDKAIKIHGDTHARLYYIKVVHDILLEMEKKDFSKPVAPNVKEVMKEMFK